MRVNEKRAEMKSAFRAFVVGDEGGRSRKNESLLFIYQE